MSILDDHCINTQRWNLVMHLHVGLLGGLDGDCSLQLQASTNFLSLLHKLLNLSLVMLSSYYCKLNSRLVFVMLVALYLTITYEYSHMVFHP
ncbi:hypothetical protein L0F63_006019 [Massospora cicadina]|nr:hypothetical protein L0F63_006019 [Massospora cicadina]